LDGRIPLADPQQPPPQVHVTLIGRRCRPKHGVVIRTTKAIDRRDLSWTKGLQVTTPARTIIDLAAETNPTQLHRLIAEARVQNLLHDGDLEAALERAQARPGAAAVQSFLRGERSSTLTRSEAERRMLRLVQAAGLPTPICNTKVAGYEVDFFWPQQRLIVEVDGFRFHGHRQAFERDRRKGLALAAAGFPVVRVTARQLMREELWLAAHLAQALAKGS
jgi:very-short-patch-repair endonuclease